MSGNICIVEISRTGHGAAGCSQIGGTVDVGSPDVYGESSDVYGESSDVEECRTRVQRASEMDDPARLHSTALVAGHPMWGVCQVCQNPPNTTTPSPDTPTCQDVAPLGT